MTRRLLAVLVGVGLVVVAAFTVIVVLVVGTTDAPEQPGTDAGFAFVPLGTEPADVAAAVMSGVFTWQPAVQESSWDALHGQRNRLTGPMATAAEQPPTLAPKPLPEWAAWARSGDTINAVVRPDAEPTVDGDTATVPVTISQTVLHTSGGITPYITYNAEVTLEKISDQWNVVSYRSKHQTR